MSIGAKCDLCGIPINSTETCNVFRMWNGLMLVEIEQRGLDSLPFDENFYVCDDCLEKAYNMLVKVKVVGE